MYRLAGIIYGTGTLKKERYAGRGCDGAYIQLNLHDTQSLKRSSLCKVLQLYIIMNFLLNDVKASVVFLVYTLRGRCCVTSLYVNPLMKSAN